MRILVGHHCPGKPRRLFNLSQSQCFHCNHFRADCHLAFSSDSARLFWGSQRGGTVLEMARGGCSKGQMRLKLGPITALAKDIDSPHLIWISRGGIITGVDIRAADSRTMEMMLPAPNTQSPSLPCVALGADAGCFRCIAASGHAVHLWDIRQLGAPHDAACVDKKVINTDFVGGWGHKIMALSMGSRGRFVLQSCKLA